MKIASMSLLALLAASAVFASTEVKSSSAEGESAAAAVRECETMILVTDDPKGGPSHTDICYCNGGSNCKPPEGVRHCNYDECLVSGFTTTPPSADER